MLAATAEINPNISELIQVAKALTDLFDGKVLQRHPEVVPRNLICQGLERAPAPLLQLPGLAFLWKALF
jgi:hypothetical protein